MKILWLADEKGWAYDQIYGNISSGLAEYEHEVFFMLAEHQWTEWARLGYRIAEADIVVSMHFKYFEFLQIAAEKTVTMLTGFRAL